MLSKGWPGSESECAKRGVVSAGSSVEQKIFMRESIFQGQCG